MKKVRGYMTLLAAGLKKPEYLETVEGEQVLTLIQSPSSVAIQGIEESAEQVAEDCGPRTAGHQVEGQQGQDDPGIACTSRRMVTTRHTNQTSH